MDGLHQAREYVAASNAHDLGRVEALIAEGAVYDSSSAGFHSGKAAIRQMMDQFFEAFAELHWETYDWQKDGDDAWAFDFTMTGKNAETGAEIRRNGTERIWVGDDGLIHKVEVRT
ncbi:MAG: nuclear transport factor 2 family protein [Hyphomicrobiales bacterium]